LNILTLLVIVIIIKAMKVVATNRKAFHNYQILDSVEVGIVLEGSEVKSLRQGSLSIGDAYARFENGEIYLFNLHITPYKFSTVFTPDPKRKRKLLLKKREIKKLCGLIQQRGNTLIPLKVYFNERGLAKISLGICRRKRLYDKKEAILKKEGEKALARIKRVSR